MKRSELALTAFDTAAQPKHYREDLVGDAIREAFSVGLFTNRSEIYVCSTLDAYVYYLTIT
jgi:hypothetical protein